MLSDCFCACVFIVSIPTHACWTVLIVSFVCSWRLLPVCESVETEDLIAPTISHNFCVTALQLWASIPVSSCEETGIFIVKSHFPSATFSIATVTCVILLKKRDMNTRIPAIPMQRSKRQMTDERMMLFLRMVTTGR